MAGKANNTADLQQQVNEVMDQFERDTEAMFRKFYEKWDSSGYHINRGEFMRLVTERMGKAYDEFRMEFEAAERRRQIQGLNENFRREVTELTEATKMLINDKDQFNPIYAERRKKFFEFLEQCTANIFSTNERAAQAQMAPSTSSASTVVATSTHKLSKNKRRQMLAAAKKQRGKGGKVTVTSVVEESNGVRRQTIITKHKTTTISISGVFERSPSCDDPNGDDHKAANDGIDNDGQKMENALKVETKKESSVISEFLKYRCVHCHDVKHWIETFHELKDVYAHWWSSHTDLTELKPFQYYVVEYVSCYHCAAIGTHYELVKHHKADHGASMVFAVVSQRNKQQCALCPYLGTGIPAHFQAMHKFVLKTLSVRQLRCIDIPFCWNNIHLDAHLIQRMHKKQKCGCCGAVFETERQLREHHNQSHKSLKITIKEFYDNHNVQLICHCCNARVERNLYLHHVEGQAFKFDCHKCAFKTDDMIDLVKHDVNAHAYNGSLDYRCMQFKNRLKRDFLKTRVIFGNGLVVTKQNLLGTKYDDSKQFEVFIDTLVQIKKERHDLEFRK